MTIRAMRWWDIPSVHVIEGDLFGADAWSVEQFWAELAQDDRRYCVLEEGGELLGYAGAMLRSPTADVQTIAVRSDAQGAGRGRALLGELLDGARAQGCTECLLEVDAGNDAAIELYRDFGFEQISVRRGYYAHGGDALIMRLRPISGGSP